MNWQDTRILRDEVLFDKKDMDEQAEVAFKAGIREVVEWIQNTKCFNHVGGVVSVDFMPGEWQAQLKEWGLLP